MATAEEMLDEVLNEAESRVLVIDLESRSIIIPPTIQHLGVESDDDVLRLQFRMARHYHEIDLSEFDIRINYKNAKGGEDLYKVGDANITDDTITFSWLVGRNAVAFSGNMNFNVCLKKFESPESDVVIKEFNTTVATLGVLKGLETSEAVVQQHADILESWEDRLFGIGDTYEQCIKDASEREQAVIEQTAEETIMQYCDENGVQVPTDEHIETVVENVIQNDLHKVAKSGSFKDLVDTPSEFNPSSHTHKANDVIGLATVATSGSYNDLVDKPSEFNPSVHFHSIMWDVIGNSEPEAGTYSAYIEGKGTDTDITSVVVDITRAGYYLVEFGIDMKGDSANGVASMCLRRESGNTNVLASGRTLVPISDYYINTGRSVNMIYIPTGTWTIRLLVKSDVTINCSGYLLNIYDAMAAGI